MQEEIQSNLNTINLKKLVFSKNEITLETIMDQFLAWRMNNNFQKGIWLLTESSSSWGKLTLIYYDESNSSGIVSREIGLTRDNQWGFNPIFYEPIVASTTLTVACLDNLYTLLENEGFHIENPILPSSVFEGDFDESSSDESSSDESSSDESSSDESSSDESDLEFFPPEAPAQPFGNHYLPQSPVASHQNLEFFPARQPSAPVLPAAPPPPLANHYLPQLPPAWGQHFEFFPQGQPVQQLPAFSRQLRTSVVEKTTTTIYFYPNF